MSATWRLRVVSPEGLASDIRSGRRQGIFTFWHRHLLTLLPTFRGYRICLPVSAHRDGEYIAHLMERYGFVASRGSSTRGGLSALRGLLSAVEDGLSCAITPDGPRGPRFTVQPGFALLARRARLPVYPIGVAARRAWVLGSWDAFMIPKPFTRVAIVAGRPIPPEEVAATKPEALCAELKSRMDEATQAARQAVG